MSDASQQSHFANIDSESYQEHFKSGDHLLVDVRELHEWMQGHLPGAVHIPLWELEDRLDEIPGDKPVVLVCAVGGRSMQGAQFCSNPVIKKSIISLMALWGGSKKVCLSNVIKVMLPGYGLNAR